MNETITLDTVLNAHKFHRNLALGITAGAVAGYALANGPRKVRETIVKIRSSKNEK